jgi:precorrin-3B methylase
MEMGKSLNACEKKWFAHAQVGAPFSQQFVVLSIDDSLIERVTISWQTLKKESG